MAVRQPVPQDKRTHVLEALQRCFEEAKGFIDEPQTQDRLCAGACSILPPATKLELMETDVFGTTVVRDILSKFRWQERVRSERLARKELNDRDDESDDGYATNEFEKASNLTDMQVTSSGTTGPKTSSHEEGTKPNRFQLPKKKFLEYGNMDFISPVHKGRCVLLSQATLPDLIVARDYYGRQASYMGKRRSEMDDFIDLMNGKADDVRVCEVVTREQFVEIMGKDR